MQREGIPLKRMICALLAALLLLGATAVAEGLKLTEALMIYEDYDGNREDQTVLDEETLQELQDMLMRARKNEAQLENCTMNCTLFCTMENGVIYDFAVATDGCPYITDNSTNQTYRLSDEDDARLWEIFDIVQKAMGYDAAWVLNW